MITSPPPKAQAQRPYLEAAQPNKLNRLALLVLGRDGFLFVGKILRHLLKWLIYVMLAELGTAGTGAVLFVFGAQSSLLGNILIFVHVAVIVVGLVGFLASVVAEAILQGTERIDTVMDRIELVVTRMIRIRLLWKRWKGAS